MFSYVVNHKNRKFVFSLNLYSSVYSGKRNIDYNLIIIISRLKIVCLHILIVDKLLLLLLIVVYNAIGVVHNLTTLKCTE